MTLGSLVEPPVSLTHFANCNEHCNVHSELQPKALRVTAKHEEHITIYQQPRLKQNKKLTLHRRPQKSFSLRYKINFLKIHKQLTFYAAKRKRKQLTQ